MADQTDWEHLRKNAFSPSDTPTYWPREVKAISMGGLPFLGVHQRTRDLYWDGKLIETTKRLANFERFLATIGATGALLAGVHPFGTTFGWW